MLGHNITYMVNSFAFSLDFPGIINNLYEMIKIFREKKLNTIYLY